VAFLPAVLEWRGEFADYVGIDGLSAAHDFAYDVDERFAVAQAQWIGLWKRFLDRDVALARTLICP
jgi:hypothetical protein